MPRVTLHAPDITCDHCIATIRRATEEVPGVRFLAGDPEARSFDVELASGGALDALAAVLAEHGYPLAGNGGDGGDGGDASGAAADHGATGGDPRAAGWQPAYRVTRTPAGADVNYDCYCGCDAGFALDRSQSDPAPEGCCCGNRILVGRDAGARLAARLDGAEAYRVVVAPLTMPWGQPLDVALAIPTGTGEAARHG